MEFASDTLYNLIYNAKLIFVVLVTKVCNLEEESYSNYVSDTPGKTKPCNQQNPLY